MVVVVVVVVVTAAMPKLYSRNKTASSTTNTLVVLYANFHRKDTHSLPIFICKKRLPVQQPAGERLCLYLLLLPRHRKRSRQCIQAAALAARVRLGVRASPVHAHAALAIHDAQVLVPDGLGVGLEEGLPLVRGPRLLELPEVPVEDALELHAVAAAGLRPVAVVHQDPRAVEHAAARPGDGVGDGARRVEVRRVARRPVQLHEPAEDDALVVRVGRLAVVLARRRVEAVVDEAVAVDHARVAEPLPGFLRAGEVRRLLVVTHVVRQARAQGNVQLYDVHLWLAD